MIDPGELAIVAAGGAVGGAARYAVSGLVDLRTRGTFPWGTLVVNATGASLLGGLAAAASAGAPWSVPPRVWAFLAVGLLGSYTTVSSFSLQTLSLLRTGETKRALLNVGLSFGLCLAGAAVGWATAARFLG